MGSFLTPGMRFMNKLDHEDMLLHIVLGVVWTIIALGIAYIVGIPITARVVLFCSIVGALMVVWREVVQGSIMVKTERKDVRQIDHMGEPIGPAFNVLQYFGKSSKFGEGLKVWEWGTQKHYETWLPAAVVIGLGFIPLAI